MNFKENNTKRLPPSYTKIKLMKISDENKILKGLVREKKKPNTVHIEK